MLRPAGLTLAVLLAATIARAQVPGVAPVPGQPPAGQPPAAPAADPKLDPHLKAWEQRMTGLTNFAATVKLTRKEAVFNKNKEYTGQVACMKPNYAILRLESTGPKPPPGKPVDYEAYICTGDAVYEYNGLDQAVTEYKITNPGGAGDNLMLDFLSGMKADDAKRRFQMSLFNQDENYVYLDIKPVQQKDRAEFEHVRFAMYGPKHAQVAYLPAQVWLQKPNGDTEMWVFTSPHTNVKEITRAAFVYTPVPGWPLKKAGAAPPPGGGMPPKGGPGVAGGGAVRPGGP